MARSAAQLLARHNDNLRLRHPRHILLPHLRPEQPKARITMVCRSRPHPLLHSVTATAVELGLTQVCYRILPYMITTSALMIIFIIIILGLIAQQQLLPGVVVLGSFILFVLWLAGLIETSIQLYGPSGAVNSYCGSRPNTQVIDSQQTAVWLANSSLCTCFPPRWRYSRVKMKNANANITGADWRAAFAFEIVGTIFLLWMMVMAYQVNRDDYD